MSFFYQGNQISGSEIRVSTSSECCAGGAYICNDGDLFNWFCHTGDYDPNPTLTFVLPPNRPFDKIVVYNRLDNCCKARIVGATIIVYDAAGNYVWRSDC